MVHYKKSLPNHCHFVVMVYEGDYAHPAYIVRSGSAYYTPL